jgi:signal transduction histidine kinase
MTDAGRGSPARIAGWALATLALLELASVPFSVSGGVYQRPHVVGEQPDWWSALAVPAFVLSGAVLVHLRPRNAIGWLLLCSGLLQVTNVAADAYGTRALTDPDGSLPFGLAGAWLASFTWFPSLLLPGLVLPALYPTGRPPNRYWRWHVRLALAGIALAVLFVALAGAVSDTVSTAAVPWDPPTGLEVVLGVPAAVLLVLAALSVVIGTVIRVLGATSPERQQLLWLLAVVLAMIGTVFLAPRALFALAYSLVPVAVTVGVLRYRLLGIEVVLRRTLLYVPLTLLVALVVGGLTTMLARLTPDGPLPLLLSSAVVAVLVIPVAGRLQVMVDRFVRGRPADPLAAVDRVGSGLEAAHDDPVAAMLEAVGSAAGATYADVTDAEGVRLATIGERGGEVVSVQLRHDGASLGVLTFGPRPGAARVADADVRLVAALAPQLAVVVRSRALTRALERERSRVAAATVSERDRLRRDLHDGLGPSLSGIALGLEAADRALATDPGAVAPLLARTREEADSAVREIRRVLDGLRPRALDVNDLPGAVRDTARSLGMGLLGGPEFALRADPLPDLAPAVEEAAFRIVAESLTNVVRHARATRCRVELARANGDLRIAVTDDGRGPGETSGDGPGPGHGLESMRRRAADLGGSVTVQARQPRGTAVLAVLPLGGA